MNSSIRQPIDGLFAKILESDLIPPSGPLHEHTHSLQSSLEQKLIANKKINYRGNLSFCWRLIFAPEKIVDYVCAHEAAHLVELNHSPRFWQTVHQLVGEWKSSKKWLKENGARLHRYG